MKNNLKETIVTVALIVVAILLLNPFHFWMPDMMVMSMLAITLALFGIFASFILRERSVDEREDQHKSLAGRNAFLAGSGILTLVFTLIGMVTVKLITRHWSDKNL